MKEILICKSKLPQYFYFENKDSTINI